MATLDLKLTPVKTDPVLKDQVFDMLQRAVLAMDVYATRELPRLDERQLAEELGVSRTPVREALARLEYEGLVQNIPRRGTFLVRKSKREIIELIEVWAALESMAARLITLRCSNTDLQALERRWEIQVRNESERSSADEYSENNIQFHQDIIALSGNAFLMETAGRSFTHMRAIRSSTIKHPKRTLQSVIDHERIIEALVKRQTAKAEKRVREHALKLAEHVREHVHFLE